jgi:hypothetical protein
MVAASPHSVRQIKMSKGAAPSMTPDLEEVIRRVQERLANMSWQQLTVRWPADDDGLWFFWLAGQPGEVQIESSNSVCPFLVETDKHDERLTASSPEETADTIIKWLQLPGGRAESPWHPR